MGIDPGVSRLGGGARVLATTPRIRDSMHLLTDLHLNFLASAQLLVLNLIRGYGGNLADCYMISIVYSL